jgi:cell division protein FtsW
MQKHWPDLWMLLSVLLLLGIGVVMIFSATPYMAYQQYQDSFYYIRKHLFSLCIAGLFFLLGLSQDYHRWRRFVLPLVVVSFLLTLGTFLPFIGRSIGGAARWLKLGIFSLQPSELVKLAVILFVAQAASVKREKIQDVVFGMFPVLIVVGVLTLPIMLQPDLGTAIVIVGTSFLMLFASGVSFWHIFIVMLLGIRVAAWFALHTPYQQARLMAFIDPWKDAQGIGFHVIQSLLAVGSGGLFGLGLGHSRQKFAYLPHQFTDFIFAILCEEGGLIIAILTLLIFLFFIFRSLRIAIQAPDRFGQMLGTGIVAYLGIQALLNIAVVLSLLPTTGVPLPFISLGGSSLTVTLFAVGVLANISLHTSES